MKSSHPRFRALAATFLASGALAVAGRAAEPQAPETLPAPPPPLTHTLPANPPLETDGEAQAKAEIEAAMQRYTGLLRTGPVADLAACYAADGALLQPGMEPLVGPEAIREFLAPLFAAVEVRSAASETESIEVFGARAYQWGTYRQVVAAGKVPRPNTTTGRYVAAWRRDGEGRWKIARLLVQPSTAPSQ